MRAFVLLSISLLTLSSTFASAVYPRSEVREHRKGDKLRHYGKSLARRDAIIGVGGSAAIGQAANTPHEWGRGAGGVAKRMGSGAAHYVVKDTIQRGVGGILHEQRDN